MGAKTILSAKINVMQFIELCCNDNIDVDNEAQSGFALLVVLSMWVSHSRVSVRQTPRYGVDETFASVSPLRVY